MFFKNFNKVSFFKKPIKRKGYMYILDRFFPHYV